ncbi:MAG: TIGR00730 family Rossman fold protein [Lachnospiraceae bacterium]|nr:TIGR00730 family Rossman fold protein [Lachnospiraceae bacterium]
MRICVFGAASDSIDHIYLQAIEEFVFRLGQEGYGLVFGGGATGLMGAAARGMRDAGGEIIGVTPTFFKDRDVELLYKGCSAMIWTETMRDRKAIMEEKSDAFVVVPGGIGTFEELFEILTLKQLGQHEKPIIFYNVADYFKAYDMLMENGINQGFISPDCRDLYFISDSTEEILDYLKNYHFDETKHYKD